MPISNFHPILGCFYPKQSDFLHYFMRHEIMRFCTTDKYHHWSHLYSPPQLGGILGCGTHHAMEVNFDMFPSTLQFLHHQTLQFPFSSISSSNITLNCLFSHTWSGAQFSSHLKHSPLLSLSWYSASGDYLKFHPLLLTPVVSVGLSKDLALELLVWCWIQNWTLGSLQAMAPHPPPKKTKKKKKKRMALQCYSILPIHKLCHIHQFW